MLEIKQMFIINKVGENTNPANAKADWNQMVKLVDAGGIDLAEQI